MRNHFNGEKHNVITIDQRSFLSHYSGRLKHRRNEKASTTPLSAQQVERVIKAAKQIGNHGMRNATFLLMAYRHGLRVDELIKLKWSHIDLDAGTIQISRLRNGQQTVHALSEQEVDYLAELLLMYPDSEHVFITATRSPLNNSVVHKMVKRAGEEAGLSATVRPGMLVAGGGFQFTSHRSH
ncbi:tyrosine-type recombinase/integrase [Kaarinaea lacus]